MSSQILFWPIFVSAQLFSVCGLTPLNPCYSSDSANGLGGIPGSAAGTAIVSALEGLDKANQGLAVAEQAYFAGDTTAQIGFGGLALISGGASLQSQLSAKLAKITGFITLRQTQVRTPLLAVLPVNTFTAARKQALLSEVDNAIKSLEQRAEPIKAHLTIVQQGFWKSVVIQTLLKTTKLVSQRLVNSLTSRYKINDVMQYADAVASNVYTAQLINDRAADNSEQLILRSIISNPLLRTKVDSAIYQRAADALELNGQAFSARTTSADDPDLYLKLVKFGAPEASPEFLKTAYENRAAEIQSAGVASAQNEILLGSGLKAPRTCEGNVNEQQAIDQKWGLANDKLQNRSTLYEGLQNAYNTKYQLLSAKEQKQLTADLKKAEADYLKAASELKAMPTSYKNTVLKICEKIASPAESVNKGIDAAFKSFSKGLSDYNDNNLPFFMNWISDIGSNIASNLIFGGDVKSTLLAESGNLAEAVNLGLSFVDANAAKKNLENGINFNYEKGNTSDEYILSWEILDVKNASFVTINGSGITDIQRNPTTGQVVIEPITKQPVQNRLPTSGSIGIKTKVGGSYSLKVYDSKGQLLTNQGSLNLVIESVQNTTQSGQKTTNPPPTYQYPSLEDCVTATDVGYCNANPSLYPLGSVRGVSVKRPTEFLRGYRTESLR